MSTAAPRKMQRFPRNALIFFPSTPPVSPLLSDPIFWGPWNWANTRSLVPLVVALLVVRGPGTPPHPPNRRQPHGKYQGYFGVHSTSSLVWNRVFALFFGIRKQRFLSFLGAFAVVASDASTGFAGSEQILNREASLWAFGFGTIPFGQTR